MAMGPDYGAGDCTWRRNACPQHKHRDGARGYYTNHRDSRWDGARERGEERRQGAPRRGGCCVLGLLPPGKGAFAGLLGSSHEQRPGTADRGGGTRNQPGTLSPQLLHAHNSRCGGALTANKHKQLRVPWCGGRGACGSAMTRAAGVHAVTRVRLLATAVAPCTSVRPLIEALLTADELERGE
jgi:hypothetical protein